MPSKKDHDLSAYEVQRLENIQRNEEFMKTLGVFQIQQDLQQRDVKTSSASPSKDSVDKLKERKRKISHLTGSHTESSDATHHKPRRSSRLSGDSTKTPEETYIYEEPPPRGYSLMPMESMDLDDNEFKVFVKLKAWRLRTCRELGIEAFKVFQNRTLCEMVRRRRNNPTWGTLNYDPLKSTEDKRQDKATLEEMREFTIPDQLMMCWGIGASKVRQDEERPGFAYGALSVLDETSASPENKRVGKEEEAGLQGDDEEVGQNGGKLSITELLQLSRDHPHMMTA